MAKDQILSRDRDEFALPSPRQRKRFRHLTPAVAGRSNQHNRRRRLRPPVKRRRPVRQDSDTKPVCLVEVAIIMVLPRTPQRVFDAAKSLRETRRLGSGFEMLCEGRRQSAHKKLPSNNPARNLATISGGRPSNASTYMDFSEQSLRCNVGLDALGIVLRNLIDNALVQGDDSVPVEINVRGSWSDRHSKWRRCGAGR